MREPEDGMTRRMIRDAVRVYHREPFVDQESRAIDGATPNFARCIIKMKY